MKTVSGFGRNLDLHLDRCGGPSGPSVQVLNLTIWSKIIFPPLSLGPSGPSKVQVGELGHLDHLDQDPPKAGPSGIWTQRLQSPGQSPLAGRAMEV